MAKSYNIKKGDEVTIEKRRLILDSCNNIKIIRRGTKATVTWVSTRHSYVKIKLSNGCTAWLPTRILGLSDEAKKRIQDSYYDD